MKKTFVLALSLLLLALPCSFGEQSQANQESGFDLMWLTLAGSVTALLFAVVLIIQVMKKEPGSKEMKEISDYIHTGAMAYLFLGTFYHSRLYRLDCPSL